MVIEDWIIVFIVCALAFAFGMGLFLLSYMLDNQPHHYYVQVNEGVGMNANG